MEISAPESPQPVNEPIAPPVAGVPPKAILLALAGGILGALIWFGIVEVSDYKLGIVAIGVGWLVGRGAVVGAAGKGGNALALASVVIAVFSMLLGEYLIVAQEVHVYLQGRPGAENLSWFLSPSVFADIYFDGIGLMDVAFYAIGAYEAWKQPARAGVAPAPAAA